MPDFLREPGIQAQAERWLHLASAMKVSYDPRTDTAVTENTDICPFYGGSERT